MIESFAQTRRSQFAEGERALSVLPGHIRHSDYKIITLLRDYYNYINSEGQPSYEINSLVDNHDIDEVSQKYIDEIAATFAASVPPAKFIDPRRFYKLALEYYKKRGSEDSVYSFFRIFFNEFVSIAYPKESIFVSSGDRSTTSDRFRLQDGEFYQDFSYVLRSENPSDEWRSAYARFVHPAGLKFFVAFLVVMTNMNCWGGPPEIYLKDFDMDSPLPQNVWWENIDWERLRGYYAPKFQAGSITRISHILVWEHGEDRNQRLAYTYDGVDDESLFAAFIDIWITAVIEAQNHRAANFRQEYQRWLKYFDSSSIDSWSSKTIEEANELWNGSNAAVFEAFSQVSDEWIVIVKPSLGYLFLYDHEDSIVYDNFGSVVEVNINDWFQNQPGELFTYDHNLNLVTDHTGRMIRVNTQTE